MDAPPQDRTSAQPWDGAAECFAACHFPGHFRTHQAEALAAFDRITGTDPVRAYLVLPPGAGKTLVGLEAARRLGRRTLVLGPNSAIQAQWAAAWRQFTPATVRAGVDRSLSSPLTVLTYQALAVFDPDAEVDEEGGRHVPGAEGVRARRRTSPLDRLHTNGRDLVARMKRTGPWTLVLDECHHLLDVWGRLLADLVTELSGPDGPDRQGGPDGQGGRDGRGTAPAVVGLTATPPSRLTREEHELVTELFGGVDYEASTPAVVRTGHLAPYCELAYLTTHADRVRLSGLGGDPLH